jgi:hypothetical protein
MRSLYSRVIAPKTTRDVKGVCRFCSHTQQVKMVAGMGNHRLKQRPANAAAPMRRQDVKPSNPSGAAVVCIGVTIKPTNANDLIVSECEE